MGFECEGIQLEGSRENFINNALYHNTAHYKRANESSCVSLEFKPRARYHQMQSIAIKHNKVRSNAIECPLSSSSLHQLIKKTAEDPLGAALFDFVDRDN